MTDLIKQAAADLARRTIGSHSDAEWIEEVIRDAVGREREACARIAETGADYALPQMAEFQRSIARCIRSRVER